MRVKHTRRFLHPELGEVTVRFKFDKTVSYELSQDALNKVGIKAECNYRAPGWWLKILGCKIPTK